MNEHLVCVGFGKCGTTLLNSLFKKSPRFVTPRETKEILYFDKADPSYEEYRDCFNLPPDLPRGIRRVLFEASPPYVSGRNRKQIEAVFRKINEVLPRSKILICLRHPAYRAYSHYIHNLHAFAVWGNHRHLKPANHPDPLLDAPCAVTFEQAVSDMPNLQTRYWDVLQLAIEVFGRDRLRLFFLEKDAAGFSAFFSRLCNDFQLDVTDYWNERTIPRVFSTDNMPAYAYCEGSSNSPMVTSKGLLHLVAGDLLVMSNRDCFILEKVTPDKAAKFREMAKLWTSSVTAAEFRDIFDKHYREDVERSVELLERYQIDTGFLPNYLSYSYKPKNLNTMTVEDEKFRLPYRVQDPITSVNEQ